MLKELGVDRFHLCCHHCNYEWLVDYDVQHVEDGHGRARDYYSLDGLPCAAPTATGALTCPRCGATWLRVELVSHRRIPLAPHDHDERLAVTSDQSLRDARRGVPLLAGQQPSTDAMLGP